MNVTLNLNITPKNLIEFVKAIEPFCDADSWMNVESNSELERETQAKEEKKEEKKPVKSKQLEEFRYCKI